MDSDFAPMLRIRCPQCGNVFEELERPLEHPEAEEPEEEYTQEGRLAECPSCETLVAMDLLELDAEGIWAVTPDD